MAIHVHEFISLDGVFENPSWTADYGFDPQMGTTISRFTESAQAILLGRRTFEMFAPAWSTRTVDDDPGAPFFNDTIKYVVGTQPPAVEWANSLRLGGYDAAAIRALTDQIEGDIYVSGSGQLVRGLLRDGLVAGLHLFVYPVALGSGEKLFRDGDTTKLALREVESYDNGVVHLNYGPA